MDNICQKVCGLQEVSGTLLLYSLSKNFVVFQVPFNIQNLKFQIPVPAIINTMAGDNLG